MKEEQKLLDTNIIEENKNCPFRDSCSCIDCDKFCMKRFKTEYYFDQAFIPVDKRFKFPLRIDNNLSDEAAFIRLADIEKNIVNFVDSGKNLYIYSKIAGNGKTSWSYRLARSYIDKVWFKKNLKPIVLFVSVPKFLLELKANISQKSEYVEHILENIKDCDLVIWDDIGSKNGTEFEVSHLLSIIDDRISNGKSNIYTSNLNRDELHQLLGDRVYSRVYNYSECIEFFGKDKRSISDSFED